MKSEPFAKGTFRLAYYAQIKKQGKVTNMIAKVFIDPSRNGDNSALLSNIEAQVACFLIPSLIVDLPPLPLTHNALPFNH